MITSHRLTAATHNHKHKSASDSVRPNTSVNRPTLLSLQLNSAIDSASTYHCLPLSLSLFLVLSRSLSSVNNNSGIWHNVLTEYMAVRSWPQTQRKIILASTKDNIYTFA